MKNDQDEVPVAPWYVWIFLILLAAVSFWCQATITEERFVPALSVIADYYKIPDDIAGATLMAAGASSPELFSSIVALFITHSSLGLGTVVGSEIFNQLVICAGAVFASKTGTLKLDPAILGREVGFYALSIGLLYIALQDTRPDPDDPSGEEHIYISFAESCMVFGGYILYVLVCANMDAVVSFVSWLCLGRSKQERTVSSSLLPLGSDASSYGTSSSGRAKQVSIRSKDKLPFVVKEASLLPQEPKQNLEKVQLYRTVTGQESRRMIEAQRSSSLSYKEGARLSLLETSLRNALGKFSDGRSLRKFELWLDPQKPSDEHTLFDVEINSREGRISCFLWQRSFFYSKAKFSKQAWHLRWFSFWTDRVTSVPDRANYERHRMDYPIHEVDELYFDPNRFILQLKTRKRNFYFLAPSQEIFETVIQKMDVILTATDETMSSDQQEQQVPSTSNEEFHDDCVSLIEFPTTGQLSDALFFVLLFPLRAAMHYTVPDVRVTDSQGNVNSTLLAAWGAVIGCLAWLIIGSYAMVASLENLASLMDIPDAIVGVTVSAAGTSLPNYVASKVAAQNGFGNMAVSNAFGSNTFNIMVGLGMPWVLYTSFGTGFQPYHGLRDEGIVQSVLILAVVLLTFCVLVIPNGFVIVKWHGYVFLGMYVAYLSFCVVQVYA